MRAGREADNQQASGRVAETGYRLAPIFLSPIGAPLYPSRFLAMRNQARTEAAGDNLPIEYL